MNMKPILLLILMLFLAGCISSPYPIIDDANFGYKGDQPQSMQPLGQQGINTAGQQRQPNQQQQAAQEQAQQQAALEQQARQQQAAQEQARQQQDNQAVGDQSEASYPQKVDIPKVNTMTVETSKGEVKIGLFPEDAPNTIQNYIDKADNNFYDGLTFHRVEDWVVQGGDPDGNGTGGGDMPTEISSREFKEGSVGVARGNDIKISNDSQFFVCKSDCSWLSGDYTIFGEVTEGMEVIKSMEIGDTINKVLIE